MAKPQVEDADDGNRRIRDKLDSIDLARREAYGIGRRPIHEQRDGDT
jgi:hypothetical protein